MQERQALWKQGMQTGKASELRTIAYWYQLGGGLKNHLQAGERH